MTSELIALLNGASPFLAIVVLWLITEERRRKAEDIAAQRSLQRDESNAKREAERESGWRIFMDNLNGQWRTYLDETHKQDQATKQQIIAETANARHAFNSLSEDLSVHHAVTTDAIASMRAISSKQRQKVSA